MAIDDLREVQTIELGRQGENKATVLQFDLNEFYNEYGKTGTTKAILIHKRQGDTKPYIVTQATNSKTLTWTLSSADTYVAGTGQAEIRYYVGDLLAKSAIFGTTVIASLMDDTQEKPGKVVYMSDATAITTRLDTAESAIEANETAIDEAEDDIEENATSIRLLGARVQALENGGGGGTTSVFTETTNGLVPAPQSSTGNANKALVANGNWKPFLYAVDNSWVVENSASYYFTARQYDSTGGRQIIIPSKSYVDDAVSTEEELLRSGQGNNMVPEEDYIGFSVQGVSGATYSIGLSNLQLYSSAEGNVFKIDFINSTSVIGTVYAKQGDTRLTYTANSAFTMVKITALVELIHAEAKLYRTTPLGAKLAALEARIAALEN